MNTLPYLIVQLATSAVGLSSASLAVLRKLAAWPLLAVTHVIFLAYFAATEQWGFWPFNVGMIGIGLWGWRTWLQQPAATTGRVIGYIIAGPNRHGRIEADWDGIVYATREAGEAELKECQETYHDWSLCALVPVGPPVASRGADEKVS